MLTLESPARGPQENRDELKTSLDELRDSFLQLKGSAVTNDELEQRVRDLVPATDDSRFQELSQSLHETVQVRVRLGLLERSDRA